MASIEWRNNNTSCRIVVSCGYLPNGKKDRRFKTVTFADGMTQKQREKEAQKQAVLFERQVESGTYLDGEKITFGEFCEKWLADYAEKQLAPATLKDYRSRLKHRLIPALGHLKLAKIQPHHLLEFYSNLGEVGVSKAVYYKPTDACVTLLANTAAADIDVSYKTWQRLRNGQQTTQAVADMLSAHFKRKDLFTVEKTVLSNKTIKHHHDLLCSVLSTAVNWNVITNNPAERVTAPKAPKSKPQFYDDASLAQLLTKLAVEPLTYQAVTFLAVDTGMRLGELAVSVKRPMPFVAVALPAYQGSHGYPN
jgi:integrase